MSADADVARRIDELAQELRRQGRAAIGAQAAAQACLERLGQLEGASGTRWLEELMPAFDALLRARAAARSLASRDDRREGLLGRVFSRQPAGDELLALAEGLSLVVEQLDDALQRLGVEIVEPARGAVDARLHRVVEVRSDRGVLAGHVVELVRRGYRMGENMVREAEVVATPTAGMGERK